MKRSMLFSMFWITALTAATQAPLADSYKLAPVTSSVSMQDLKNLAGAAGVRMEIFDYEIPFAHCLHFSVQLDVDDKPPEILDSRGECVEAGHNRLTIQWRHNEGQLKLYFYLFNMAEGSGGGLGGPTIDLGDYNASGGGRVVYAQLDYENPSPVVDVTYSKVVRTSDRQYKKEFEKRFVVFVELRGNPEGIIGTE